MLTVLWLALGQLSDGGVPAEAEEARSVQPAVRSAQEIEVRPSGSRLQLKNDQEVICARLKPSKRVPSGEYRVQCDNVGRQCLVAPTRVLDQGVETLEPLARTRYCVPVGDEELLETARLGYGFFEAVADSPDGWYRDDSGRIIQVNFDLHRRVYFGGAWSPDLAPDGKGGLTSTFNRGRVDMGIDIDFFNTNGDEVHHLHLLEGSAWVGAQTRVDVALARYGWTAQHYAAPIWITTFVGKPRRIDLDVNLTAYIETLRLEVWNQQGYLTIGSAQASLDLWHSKDLDSFLRLRAGPGLEFDLATKNAALKTEAALDGDFTLDRDGFHHILAQVQGEKLFFDPVTTAHAHNPQRLRTMLGYEVILLAINDYPLSLVLDGRATWRDDLPNVKPGWDFSGNVGLRFSFWAPARRNASPVVQH